MIYRLVYRPRAEADLNSIYDLIADWAGPASAQGIVNAIEERCGKLVNFPNRGTPHPEVLPGLRTTVLGKAVIAYVVEGNEVVIVHIKYGGQALRRENLG